MTGGIAGATNNRGNTSLVEYGIQTEKSDARIHVCVKARRLYLYQTQAGVQIIKTKPYRCVPVYTKGIITAKGYLVPPRDIPTCKQVSVPDEMWQRSGILPLPEKGYQKEKGKAAVYIITEALKQGMIPLALSFSEINDQDMQIEGTDILIRTEIRLQVKCDYSGGPRAYGGTGNLFLQIAECNPFQIY